MARFEMVRTVLAIAAQFGWKYQFDVKSVFLNGGSNEEVYSSQPDGFVIKEAKSKVYKLKRALFRLKKSP